MNALKNFFIYFFTVIGIALIIYSFGALIFYLLDQAWGLIGIVILIATLAGIAGAIKGD